MNNINYGAYEGFNVLSSEQASQLIDPQIQKDAAFDAVLVEIKKDGYEYFYITEFFKMRMKDGEYYSGRVPQDAFSESFRERTSQNFYIYIPSKYLQTEKEIKSFNNIADFASQHVLKKRESIENMNKIAAAYLEANDIHKELIVWNGKDTNRNYAYGKVVSSDHYHILLQSYEAADKVYMRVVSRTNMRTGVEGEVFEQILTGENNVKIDWVPLKEGRGVIPYIRNNLRVNERVSIENREFNLANASELIDKGFRDETFLVGAIHQASQAQQKQKSLSIAKDLIGIDLNEPSRNKNQFNEAIATVMNEWDEEEKAKDEERRLAEAERLSFDNKRVERQKTMERVGGSGKSM